MKQYHSWKALTLGFLSGFLGSLCCVGPLVLFSLGLGGAWMGTLTSLAPYRPYTIGFSVLVLSYAFYKLYIHPKKCRIDQHCPPVKALKYQRIAFWIVVAIVFILIMFPWYGHLIYGN